MSDTTRPGDQKLSKELGADVETVELLLRFRIDHARMMQGQAGQLGYIRMERQHNFNAIIVFGTPEEADKALNDSLLIDSLAEEDCLECDTLVAPVIADLAGCEIIIADKNEVDT